jgi:signal peptidase II
VSLKRWVSLIDPLVVGIGLFFFGLDQLTKYLVVQSVGPGATIHSIEILGSFVRISYTTNTGAVFGIFHGGVSILAVVSLVAVPIILFSRAFFPSNNLFTRICLGLLFAGALGNLADRWLRGYVVDFVDMGIGDLRWYVYNVADACFIIGVIGLIVAMLFFAEDQPEGATAEASGKPGDSGEAPRPS